MSPVPSLVQTTETRTSSLSDVSQILGSTWRYREGKEKAEMTTHCPTVLAWGSGSSSCLWKPWCPFLEWVGSDIWLRASYLDCGSSDLPLHTNEPDPRLQSWRNQRKAWGKWYPNTAKRHLHTTNSCHTTIPFCFYPCLPHYFKKSFLLGGLLSSGSGKQRHAALHSNPSPMLQWWLYISNLQHESSPRLPAKPCSAMLLDGHQNQHRSTSARGCHLWFIDLFWIHCSSCTSNSPLWGHKTFALFLITSPFVLYFHKL